MATWKKISSYKFYEFFLSNYDQFIFISPLIKYDIALLPSNKVKNPISPDEKLAVTLNYICIFLFIKHSFNYNVYIDDGSIKCLQGVYEIFYVIS